MGLFKTIYRQFEFLGPVATNVNRISSATENGAFFRFKYNLYIKSLQFPEPIFDFNHVNLRFLGDHVDVLARHRLWGVTLTHQVVEHGGAIWKREKERALVFLHLAGVLRVVGHSEGLIHHLVLALSVRGDFESILTFEVV